MKDLIGQIWESSTNDTDFHYPIFEVDVSGDCGFSISTAKKDDLNVGRTLRYDVLLEG